MYEEYEYANEVSFAALEKAEAEKFTSALADLDSRLCTSIQAETLVINCTTSRDSFPKYYSEGYDANHEGVDDSEIVQWQRSAFKFLSVEGKAIPLPPPGTLSSLIGNSSSGYDISLANDQHYIEDLNTLPKADDVIRDLHIVGKALAIPKVAAPVTRASTSSSTPAVDEDDGEIIAQHGILQEYVDYSGVCDTAESTTSQSIPSPAESNREEIVSSMMDAVWPEVVGALKPLIYKVLVAAKENNIPFVVDQTAAVKSEYGEEGDFGGDDFW